MKENKNKIMNKIINKIKFDCLSTVITEKYKKRFDFQDFTIGIFVTLNSNFSH